MDYNRRGSPQARSQVNAPPPNPPSSTPTWGGPIESVHMLQPQNTVNAPAGGGTVVTVTVNRDGENTPSTTQHDGFVANLPAHSGPNRDQDSEDSPVLGRTARADHEIYSDQLLTKKRGYPLWVPGPAMQLPIEYRRQGVSIGDVGIITSSGEFDFLFNIFRPADDPINRGLVPQGFSPLPLEELAYDIQKAIIYGPDTYLASSSVRKIRRNWILRTFSGQRFESTATEAAILIMPNGAITQNLLNTWLVRRVISRDAKVWYRYARYIRGRDVKNGDIRVVVGIDKVPSWGIATSACSTGQTASYVFKRDPTHLYRWDCTSGSGRVGPQKVEIHDLMENNTVPQNQCVFVRTINFTIPGSDRPDLPLEVAEQLDSGRSGDQDSAPSNRGGSKGGAGSTSSGLQPGSMQGSSHCDQSVKSDSVRINHPSAALHNSLHEKFPDADMIITEDMDWISVLNDDDTVFPQPEDLCERILKTHALQNHLGIIQLLRKDDTMFRPSTRSGQDLNSSATNAEYMRVSKVGKSPEKRSKYLPARRADENRDIRPSTSRAAPYPKYNQSMTLASSRQQGFMTTQKGDENNQRRSKHGPFVVDPIGLIRSGTVTGWAAGAAGPDLSMWSDIGEGTSKNSLDYPGNLQDRSSITENRDIIQPFNPFPSITADGHMFACLPPALPAHNQEVTDSQQEPDMDMDSLTKKFQNLSP